MFTSAADPKVWYRTEFEFPAANPCQCYKHKTRNGNRKHCGIRSTAIALTDPDKPGNDLHRFYCLDCWIRCRDEQTVINPAQARVWEQNRKAEMTLRAMGC